MKKAAPDTSTLTLCAFRAAGLDEASGGKLPDRLVVAPWGTHDLRKRGVCTVNETTLDVFAACQKAMRLDGEVALDFDHNTVPGTPSFISSAEPRKVAAFGVPVVERGVGVVLTALRWTPEGKSAMEGGHYRDLSPAVFRRKDGTVYGLHSAGVCRHGEIEGLTIESAQASAQLAPLFAALSALSASLETTTPIVSPSMKAAIAKLLAALGVTVAAEADDAAFETAITDGATKLEALVKTEKPEALNAEQTGAITTLTARLDTMEKAEEGRKRTALIAGAVAEGKLIALSADVRDACPLNVLEDHIKQLKPGVVPLTRTSPTGAGAETPQPEAFSAESVERLASLGVTVEDVAKFAPHLAPKKAA